MNTTNHKETSDRIAHLAAVVLRRPGASHLEKELAGSALAQHHTHKETSTAIGSLAAKVLSDHESTYEAKELAGCVLSQVRHLHGVVSDYQS
ncbi:hypothetical protein [Paraburkholderia sp. BCC1886]|uniref:hypothetical protein n=1 Tax=Paraburkholderia sp. BCC1886 TaxID=2562670 RepID=UPI00118210AF|nr:hypothetical protein [Paraburkholderia sp. BCC1886]